MSDQRLKMRACGLLGCGSAFAGFAFLGLLSTHALAQQTQWPPVPAQLIYTLPVATQTAPPPSKPEKPPTPEEAACLAIFEPGPKFECLQKLAPAPTPPPSAGAVKPTASPGKSPADCEAEIRYNTAAERTKAMVICLIGEQAATDSKAEAPAAVADRADGKPLPGPGKSAADCEAEIRYRTSEERTKAMVDCLLGEPTAQRAKTVGISKPSTHFIEEFGIERVNSAGGVEPAASIVNPNRKSAIKYLRLYVTLYNAVGDPIVSRIGGRSGALLSYTGPLFFEDGTVDIAWEPAWYNSTADCIKITSIQVDFMDGSRRSFTGAAVAGALAPGMSNDCRPRRK